MFVSGIHKVIFDEFESGITNTYEQNNNKMNANLAKVSFVKHIGFINRANQHDSSEITGKDYKSFVRLAVLGEPILDPRALSFSKNCGHFGKPGGRDNTLSTLTRAKLVTGTTPNTQSSYLFPQ